MSIDYSDKIETDLQSSDIVRQVNAIRSLTSGAFDSLESPKKQCLYALAVEALESSKGAFPIADAISALGKNVEAPLEKLLGHSSQSNVKLFAALLLARMGNLSGKDLLIAEIKNCGELQILAANILVKSHTSEHLGLIIDRLRSYSIIYDRYIPSAEDEVIISLLHVLKKSGECIPIDIQKKFFQGESPRYFRGVGEEKVSE